MTPTMIALTGAEILIDGGFVGDRALVLRGSSIWDVVPANCIPQGAVVETLGGGRLIPGFVDLQVNGGGGVMFNDAPDVQTLRTIAAAHAGIGATSILPTLITDTAKQVSRAIQAVEDAIEQKVPGIIGLHLEGPHLSEARKGAHDGDLIRPMTDQDLRELIDAAGRIPVLKVTVAPESVDEGQIKALSDAGVLVSLGHTDAGFDVCKSAAHAGARCVTHLFNAQSQMGNREPGVVGAALALDELSAGLIADGVHVHPASMVNALRAKTGPGQIFLVSDAMATAGSDVQSFQLNGREIRRAGNRLTLQDGTLAGAHLPLAVAIRNLVEGCDIALPAAIEMASRTPAELVGATALGHLSPGTQADVLLVTEEMEIKRVWQKGRAV